MFQYIHQTSRYITCTAHDQFYQAFPRVSTVSYKHWGEKAWIRGYGLLLLQTLICTSLLGVIKQQEFEFLHNLLATVVLCGLYQLIIFAMCHNYTTGRLHSSWLP